MSIVNVQVSDHVAHVELNRPEVRNAFNLEMIRELTRVIDDLATRDDVHALVLSGAGGKAFAGGAHNSELAEPPNPCSADSNDSRVRVLGS